MFGTGSTRSRRRGNQWRSYRVRIALVGEPPLQIGMSAETNVVVAQLDAALLLPASAVADGRMWKVEGGRRAPPVTVGVRTRQVIRDGLAEADP